MTVIQEQGVRTCCDRAASDKANARYRLMCHASWRDMSKLIALCIRDVVSAPNGLFIGYLWDVAHRMETFRSLAIST